MASKEIITRIKHQLEDGYIDINDSYDNDEMNYVRKAIYDLGLYKKAIYMLCEEKKKEYTVLCGDEKGLVKTIIDEYLGRAREELEREKQ